MRVAAFFEKLPPGGGLRRESMKITGRMILLLHDLKKVKYTQTMEIRVFENAVEMSGHLRRTQK